MVFTRKSIWEMGKNKFCQPENQFPQAEIVIPEFQKLQQSSE